MRAASAHGLRVRHLVSGRFWGGGQQAVASLVAHAERRRERDTRAILLGYRSESPWNARCEAVAYNGRYDRVRTLLSTASRLRRVLRQGRANLLHSHGWDASVIAALALYGTGIRHVAHWHSADSWLDRGGVRARVRRVLTRGLLSPRRTTTIVAAESIRCRLRACFGWPLSAMRVVRNGVDTERFRPNGASRETAPARGGTLVVGCAARLSPSKGIETLIDAMEILRGRGADVRVRLAGGGAHEGVLRARIEAAGIQDVCELLGEVDEMPAFYATVDVIVLPSLAEGTPLTVLEAMSCGVPVVATDVGDVRMVVRDGVDGFVIPTGGCVVLADRLERVLADPLLRRSMGQAARRRVADEFSLERFAREITTVHEAVFVGTQR